MAGSIGGDQGSARHGIQVVVLGRVRGASEHVEHARRDGEAATDVDSRCQHSCGGQALKTSHQDEMPWLLSHGQELGCFALGGQEVWSMLKMRFGRKSNFQIIVLYLVRTQDL